MPPLHAPLSPTPSGLSFVCLTRRFSLMGMLGWMPYVVFGTGSSLRQARLENIGANLTTRNR